MKQLLTLFALAASLFSFGQCAITPSADLDQDGIVGTGDVLALLSQFGMTISTPINPVHTVFSVSGSASLANADLRQVQVGCGDFSLVDFTGAEFEFSYFDNSSFVDANFTGANLRFSNFFQSDFQGAGMQNADLTAAQILDCNLQNVDLSGADLSLAILTGTDLSGADLTGTLMDCVSTCPSQLPPGYTCVPNDQCSAFRIE